jgi:hypothetical protein
MKPCFSAYNCPHCLHRATCETYQRLKQQLTEGKTSYELMIARPDLANEYRGV